MADWKNVWDEAFHAGWESHRLLVEVETRAIRDELARRDTTIAAAVEAWKGLDESGWMQGDPFPSDLDSALARLAALSAPVEAGTPAECERDAVTPTDDGVLIVDCTVHGEVARVPTSGTVDRVVPGDDEFGRVEQAWATHVAEAGTPAAEPAPDLPPHPRIWWDGHDFLYLLPGLLLGPRPDDPTQLQLRRPGFYRAQTVEDVTSSDGPLVELRALAGSGAPTEELARLRRMAITVRGFLAQHPGDEKPIHGGCQWLDDLADDVTALDELTAEAPAPTETET